MEVFKGPKDKSMIDERMSRLMGLIEGAVDVVNEMQTFGLFERYAIGGGAAITFHMEPFPTRDLDIFVFLKEDDRPPARNLVLMTPIYKYLADCGYATDDVWAYIRGVRVQFLPVYNALTEEAIDMAIDTTCGMVPARVFKVEHILAVMIQTARGKDKERIERVFNEADVDETLLEDILVRHGLLEKWEDFWNEKRRNSRSVR
jgi:hypothetical protein